MNDLIKLKDMLSRLFFDKPFDPMVVPDPLDLLAVEVWGRPYNHEKDPAPLHFLGSILYGSLYDPTKIPNPVDWLEKLLAMPRRNYIPNMNLVNKRLIGVPKLKISTNITPVRPSTSPVETFKAAFEKFKEMRSRGLL